MTVHSASDVAGVVKGLTKAQRALLVRGANGDFAMTTVRALVAKGLWYLRIDSPNGQCGFMEPTPLGHAARAAILSEREGEGRDG